MLVGIIQLRRGVNAQSQARQKLHCPVKVCAVILMHIDLCGRDARIRRADTLKQLIHHLLVGQLLVLIFRQHVKVFYELGDKFLTEITFLSL